MTQTTTIARKEYLKLLENSEIFKSLTEDLQKRMKAAKGKQMQDYAELLGLANNDLLQAKKEFVAGAQEAVQEMRVTVTKAQKSYLVKVETMVQAKDEAEAEDMINNI